MQRLLLFWVAVLAMSAAGCSKPAPATSDSSMGEMHDLLAAYQRATEQLGHPPRNRSELAPHLPAGVDADGLFRRFVIIWGADPRPPDSETKDPLPMILAYTKETHDGMRLVATVMGVFEMAEQDFQKGSFPAGHKPGASAE